MDFEVKDQTNREKNGSKNDVFLDCVFLSILGGFGEGLGRVLGGGWSLLGVSWATFGRHFLVLVAGMLSGRALGGSWAGFGRVLGGVGEGSGRGLGGFGS